MFKTKDEVRVKGIDVDLTLKINHQDDECFISQWKEGENELFYFMPTNFRDSILIKSFTFSLDKAVEIRDFLDKYIKLAKEHGYRE